MLDNPGNPMLCEIIIKDDLLPIDKRFFIIKSVYEKFLQEDELWHFFYEEEEGDIIRCSPENLIKITDFLDECGFEYTAHNSWNESLYDVINNPEYFARLFHLNSEFIINNALKIGDRMTIFIDRYSHNLYLNYGFAQGEFKQSEQVILSDVLLSRSFYSGMRFQYLKAVKAEREKDG